MLCETLRRTLRTFAVKTVAIDSLDAIDTIDAVVTLGVLLCESLWLKLILLILWML